MANRKGEFFKRSCKSARKTEGGLVRQNTTVLGSYLLVRRSYDSCVLTDPPNLICIKHNGDDEPEARKVVTNPNCTNEEINVFRSVASANAEVKYTRQHCTLCRTKIHRPEIF
jgi:hypothetical protein